MRRRHTLLALVFASIGIAIVSALAACGSGGKSGPPPCDYNAARTATATRVLHSISVEEAQSQVDFHISLPAELPTSILRQTISVNRPQICPTTILGVTLFYKGNGFTFTIDEGTFESTLRSTPIIIGGAEGMMEPSVAGAKNYLIVTWTRRGVSFEAFAHIAGDLTEEAFLAILRSIP